MSPKVIDARLALTPEQRLKIHEIFYSLQGESTRQGRPCVLVRLTGCQMRCTWCDSTYSFYEGRWCSLEEVLAEVEAYACPMVEVTGGEPLLQKGVYGLMQELCDRGYEVLLETGGGLDISRVDSRVRRILDVKCPASGEAEANRWQNMDLLCETDEVKFVLAGEEDYRWACDVLNRYRLAAICPVHFTPVEDRLTPAMLASWILRDRLPVSLGLQLHKILWGSDSRGV